MNVGIYEVYLPISVKDACFYQNEGEKVFLSMK